MLTPVILNGSYGFPSLTGFKLRMCGGSNPINHGSWITNNGGTYEAVASAGANVDSIVDGILDSDGRSPKRNGYLTATETAAAANYLRLIPVGGLILLIEEDGVGGVITDADLATKIYYDVVVGTGVGIGQENFTVDGYNAVQANIKIDSSSGETTAGANTIQVLSRWPAPTVIQFPVGLTNPAWAAAPGLFVCQIVADAVQSTQGSA